MPDQYDIDAFMDALKNRSPGETEFHQAAGDVVQDLIPIVNDRAEYRAAALLERLTEPDRVISFRVGWRRDDGSVAVNRGYRVQFNSAIGPYKGGLRFHPSVTPSILKFLGFEQVFKNALTGLPMGGAKGGADFDPDGCSEAEIERFCHAFMLELHRHIGPDRDVPAGDINVGEREIGYLFGAFGRITGLFDASLTGKGLAYGGSEMRTEATGHGLIHFVSCMLARRGQDLEGRSVLVSGAGNVATYAAEKALSLGAHVKTLSDSRGFILDKDGLTSEKIAWVRRHKATSGASLEGYADEFGGEWHAGAKPWGVEADLALPCATQNELDEDDAKSLANGGVTCVAEGANMPLTAGARDVFREAGVSLGPGKAANAGGVALSGLEISQNRRRMSDTRDTLADQLEKIMQDIHDRVAEEGERPSGDIDYARGANVAGFRKLADAMTAQGLS